MKNRTLALLGTGGIIYRKEIREYAGSVTGSLLMQQLDYWFTYHPDGFYKFLDPTPKHPDYREGDSWTEELGFSKAEFRTAFDGIGVRHPSKSAYLKSPTPFMDVTGEKFYCSYHDKKNGLTWYFRNHPRVDELINEICKAQPAKYRKKPSKVEGGSESTVNKESESTVNKESESIDIHNVDLHRSTNLIYIDSESESTFYIQRLSSEITPETTSESFSPYPQNQNGEEREEKSQSVDCKVVPGTGNREQGTGKSALEQIPSSEQKKPESLQSTNNPSLGQNSPPLKNGFQQLSGINPKTGREYFPWQGMENNRVGIDPKFLGFVAKSLTSKYESYKKLKLDVLGGEVKKYVNRAQYNQERLDEIWTYWDEYNNPSELPDVTIAQVKTATAVDKMIEGLRARGYQ